MPAKRKKSHESTKQLVDPLGKFFWQSYNKSFVTRVFFGSDDIMRKNLYLTKHARSADQLRQLGKGWWHTWMVVCLT